MTQNPKKRRVNKRTTTQQLKVNSGCLLTLPSSNVYLTWVSFTLGCGLLVGCKAVYSSAAVVADLPSASCRCGVCLYYYVCAFLCSIVSSLHPLALLLACSLPVVLLHAVPQQPITQERYVSHSISSQASVCSPPILCFRYTLL